MFYTGAKGATPIHFIYKSHFKNNNNVTQGVHKELIKHHKKM